MIIYTPPTSNFTIVPNKILKNKELSANARFIAVYILSLPKSWNLNLEHLSKELDMSERTLQKGIRELIAANVLEKMQLRDSSGQFSQNTIYSFGDFSQIESDKKEEVLDFEELSLEELEQIIELESKQENEQSLQAPILADTHRSEKNPHTDIFHPYKELNNNKINKNNIFVLRSANQIKLLNLCFARTPKKSLKQLPQGFNELELRAFERFIAYRKERGKLTKSTLDSIVRKFESFKKQGIDICGAVEESINKGWVGIFAPRVRKPYPAQSNPRGSFVPNRDLSARFSVAQAEYEARTQNVASQSPESKVQNLAQRGAQ